MADIAASVLAKLKNKAKVKGISYMQCLQLFCQEEFLRKLSKSKYVNNLVLKGGLLIYTLTNFESRATIDVDFLLQEQSNTIENIQHIIQEVIDFPTGNDFIWMEAKAFEVISPQRRYKGVSAQIIAHIKNVRVPINIDIGVGDVVIPKPERRRIQTQLSDYEIPEIFVYSLESTIAEKFDAILQRYELTGRMKDFYDIYYLALNFDYEGIKLQTAIFETLQNRGTPYEKDSFNRIMELVHHKDMQIKWRFFLKKLNGGNLEFTRVIDVIQAFLDPVFNAILAEVEWQKKWTCSEGTWTWPSKPKSR